MVYTNLYEFDCDISNFSSVHHAAFDYRNQPVLSNEETAFLSKYLEPLMEFDIHRLGIRDVNNCSQVNRITHIKYKCTQQNVRLTVDTRRIDCQRIRQPRDSCQLQPKVQVQS